MFTDVQGDCFSFEFFITLGSEHQKWQLNKRNLPDSTGPVLPGDTFRIFSLIPDTVIPEVELRTPYYPIVPQKPADSLVSRAFTVYDGTIPFVDWLNRSDTTRSMLRTIERLIYRGGNKSDEYLAQIGIETGDRILGRMAGQISVMIPISYLRETFLKYKNIGYHTEKDFKKENFDYFVVSSGRKSRTLKLSYHVDTIASFKKAYGTENFAKKIIMGGRADNYVKILYANDIYKK